MKEIKIVANKAGWNVKTVEINFNLHWAEEGWQLIQITERWLILERDKKEWI